MCSFSVNPEVKAFPYIFKSSKSDQWIRSYTFLLSLTSPVLLINRFLKKILPVPQTRAWAIPWKFVLLSKFWPGMAKKIQPDGLNSYGEIALDHNGTFGLLENAKRFSPNTYSKINIRGIRQENRIGWS